ncbi:STM4015 family protein [Actinomadura sp. B10D3]|uniref:STM4015 family protein n=1 Tax=Actinomadura sp. B10D3 TaxID=3153557 RepID=UPI00325D4153
MALSLLADRTAPAHCWERTPTMHYGQLFAGLPIKEILHHTVEDEILSVSYQRELRDFVHDSPAMDTETHAEIRRFAERLRALAHESDPAQGVAWRVAGDEETPFQAAFERFLHTVDTYEVTALVIGYWGAIHEEHKPDPVRLLTRSAHLMPQLEALFLGDVSSEEQELSWIHLSDVTPLLEAFPRLERLDIRSGSLALRPTSHDRLKTLRIESGGLPGEVVRAVAASDLPRLEHLDLWLGVGLYGGDATVADLEPILGGARLPALRHLGLEDSEIQDEIAAAVAGAPVVARLETLSLAMGMLSDEGAAALLSGQPLTHLKKLDLHHHYVSDAMAEKIHAALPGVSVDLSESVHLSEGYAPYVAVSE